MELIKINQTEKGMTVDGRELHEFLEVGRDFSTWIKDKIEKYGFIEGMDFSPKSGKTSDGGRPRIDYELSIDMAKELCMVENNEKGRQARKYFIECERRLKQNAIQPMTTAEMIAAIAQQAVEQERRMAALEASLDRTNNAVETLTNGFTSVPDHTKVVQRVNEYARWTRLGHNEVYNKIYDILQARHGIDVRQRVENERHRINTEYFSRTGKQYSESTLKSKVNGIDIMVRMGVLDKFNEILVGMLAKAKSEKRL